MADYERFNLRFTDNDELRLRLEDAAKKSNRSLHAEIMLRLSASFAPAPIEARVEELERQVAALKKGRK